MPSRQAWGAGQRVAASTSASASVPRRAVLCGGGALVPLAWEARLQKFAGYGACFDKPGAGEVKQCSSVA
jgi:hypothetical protein